MSKISEFARQYMIVDRESIVIPDRFEPNEEDVQAYLSLVNATGKIVKFPIVLALGYDPDLQDYVFELRENAAYVLEASRRLGIEQVQVIIANSESEADNFLEQVE